MRAGRMALLAALCGAAVSESSRNAVTSLPGWSGDLPSKIWTGFVEVDAATDTNLFYWLAEAEKPNAPLVWWIQGGPGASSSVGMFEEVGPFLLNSSSTLIRNPFRWTQEANVLFVEFSAGIGYSYCENSTRTDLPCKQSSGMCSPCLSSDDTAADQNLAFYKGFLKLFPEFGNTPLYLTGESYAGVYMPMLAQRLVRNARYGSGEGKQLTGAWATDPCTDSEAQSGYLDFDPLFAFQAGMLSEQTKDTLLSSACSKGKTAVGDFVRRTDTRECRAAWRVYDLATSGIGGHIHPAPIKGLPLYVDPLCALGPNGGVDTEGYLGSPAVRKAIHAEQSKNAVYHIALDNNGYEGYTTQYSACNDRPLRPQSMVEFWREVLSVGGPALRTIILSSGDIDPVVSLHGTEKAVYKTFGGVEKGGERRPWFYNKTGVDVEVLRDRPLSYGRDLHTTPAGAQFGGFTTTMLTNSTTVSAHFVTFRDSGHMVPKYVPQKAYHVFTKLLLGGNDLSPGLPDGWDTEKDGAFYGGDKQGTFADWVARASSAEYL
eukprot:Hpha_TRINITY_DN26427_c0_g1::TRINITY_DN26427_c0_g1_i1::g.34000::m.34000/K13289/CTSA, CPY; cathepsin A (carboxypeptidase C)